MLKRSAIDILHDKKVQPRIHSGIQSLYDVGVRKTRRMSCFLQKFIGVLLFYSEFREKDFTGDGSFKNLLLRQIDHAVAAAAEFPDQQVIAEFCAVKSCEIVIHREMPFSFW